MTTPCSKEADIATLIENAKWQKKLLGEIRTDTRFLVEGQSILKTKVGFYALIWGGIPMALVELFKAVKR